MRLHLTAGAVVMFRRISGTKVYRDARPYGWGRSQSGGEVLLYTEPALTERISFLLYIWLLLLLLTTPHPPPFGVSLDMEQKENHPKALLVAGAQRSLGIIP